MNIRQDSPKKVSIICFHDELCQVFNALVIALNLLRSGAQVTIFFTSRGVNALHRDKIKLLSCVPEQPQVERKDIMRRMAAMNLPEAELLLEVLILEGAAILACPLNLGLFGVDPDELAPGVRVADPATYYKDVIMGADINLTF
ncbi:MAG: DsrE/DsrF/DrsH-like family protein [Candidatus Aquicultor sp.]